MSMNVYIVAEREISYKKKNGKTGSDVQRVKFDAIHTPTTVTYNIVGSADPKQAYIEYVESNSSPVKEPIHAPGDIFCERDPIGFRDHDWTVEHIKEFHAWVTKVEDQGYTVQFEVI